MNKILFFQCHLSINCNQSCKWDSLLCLTLISRRVESGTAKLGTMRESFKTGGWHYEFKLP